MNTTKGITALFSLLVLMAAAAWFFLTDSSSAKPTEDVLNSTPDHRFTSLEIEQFDTLGHRLHALKTPYAHHVPGEQHLWLKTPLIWVTEAEQPAWSIHAEEATVSDDGKEVIFKTQVEVTHRAFKNIAAGVFKSELLSYFPKTQRASTPLKITWEQEHNTLEAIGMEANLADHHINLLHDARAIYRPAHG